MTTTPLRVCWVDEDWDRSNASDRVSRYGAYLRGHSELFDPWREATGGITQDPGEFAIAALQVACGPIMSPGYVHWHPRVLDHLHGPRLVRTRGRQARRPGPAGAALARPGRFSPPPTAAGQTRLPQPG